MYSSTFRQVPHSYGFSVCTCLTGDDLIYSDVVLGRKRYVWLNRDINVPAYLLNWVTEFIRHMSSAG